MSDQSPYMYVTAVLLFCGVSGFLVSLLRAIKSSTGLPDSSGEPPRKEPICRDTSFTLSTTLRLIKRLHIALKFFRNFSPAESEIDTGVILHLMDNCQYKYSLLIEKKASKIPQN